MLFMKPFILLLLFNFCLTALSAQPRPIKRKGVPPMPARNGLAYRLVIGESSSHWQIVDGWMGESSDFRYTNPYDLTETINKVRTDNDTLFRFSHYRKGKLSNGQVVEYHETFSGKRQLAFAGNCKQGLLYGKAWFYFTEEDLVYEPNLIKATGHYMNGELVGDWIQYDINGRITSRAVYRKNQESPDSIIEFHENGPIKSLYVFLPNGKYKSAEEFYPEGRRSSFEILTLQKGDDYFYDYTEYYPNGSIKLRGKYLVHDVHRDKIGTWEEFEPDGQPKKKPSQ